MARVVRLRVTVGAVAALVCAACGNSFSGPEAREVAIDVQGTITAVGTGLPIDSAFVDVRTDLAGGFAEVYSDSTGHYTFSFVYRYFRGEVFCPFIVFISHEDFLEEFFALRCVEGVQTVDVQLAVASPARSP